eukprot:scaffold5458_cov131-Isochrysis_galbana.AAC.12
MPHKLNCPPAALRLASISSPTHAVDSVDVDLAGPSHPTTSRHCAHWPFRPHQSTAQPHVPRCTSSSFSTLAPSLATR